MTKPTRDIKKDKYAFHKQQKKKNKDDDDDETSSSDHEEESMNEHEIRKFMGKIFPSKHMENKVKAGERLKSKLNPKLKEDSEEEVEWETASEEEAPTKQKQLKTNAKASNVNITFTIGRGEDSYDEDYDDEDDEDYEDESISESENEDESVSSDSSGEDDESEYDEEEEELICRRTRNKSKYKNVEPRPKDLKPDTDVVAKLKELLEQNQNNKIVQKCIDMYEDEIAEDKKKQAKKIAKTKAKNVRIFRKKVNDKNAMNDVAFYSKLDIDEQKLIIKELREINKITQIEKPYRMTLLESKMPIIFKAAAMKKINAIRHMDPGSGEFYKIKNWIDAFMRIPFNIDKSLTINIDDGVDKCHEFMENAQNTLNQAVYGLNDAKMQIMQMLGQLVTNPKSIGTAIAIHGPPGTGKTSLVKEGISKILNRPFAFIALGGATDSSFLEGHSYTYEGSTWGKIVQILIDSKCMNPVIYFDELDKISETPRGDEIAGILTHLTDTSQNSQFHDKYFAEIDFDLSKCLFIFSYNDETKVNSILKDRMYRIQTKGYDLKQKTVIGNDYLLPRIREQVKFESTDVIIPDETIRHIIENHCNKEAGVRNLKRCLEIIHTKLNLYRLMKPGSNLFEEDMSLNVTFPFTVTKDIVDKLIKYDSQNTPALYSMYV
jgi:ATP-dependent Lon protease